MCCSGTRIEVRGYQTLVCIMRRNLVARSDVAKKNQQAYKKRKTGPIPFLYSRSSDIYQSALSIFANSSDSGAPAPTAFISPLSSEPPATYYKYIVLKCWARGRMACCQAAYSLVMICEPSALSSALRDFNGRRHTWLYVHFETKSLQFFFS